jgi:hypothetical protein
VNINPVAKLHDKTARSNDRSKKLTVTFLFFIQASNSALFKFICSKVLKNLT